VATGDLYPVLMYAVAVVLFGCTVILYFTRVSGWRLFASAPTVFLLTQVLFFVGTLLVVDWYDPDERLWALCIVAGCFAFTLGGVLANSYYGFRPNQEIEGFVRRPVTQDLDKAAYWVFMGAAVVCVVVGIAFARAVGYNTFQSAFLAFAQGEPIDPLRYARLRTSISRETYVAAGYAVQFTAIILPICIYLLYLRFRQNHRAADAVLIALLSIADLYFLTLQGGRYWLLNSLVVFLLLIGRRTGPVPPEPGSRAARLSQPAKLFSIALLVAFYVFATMFMGRVNREDRGLTSAARGASGELYDRVMGYQAETQLRLMHYLRAQGVVWGEDWTRELASIFPETGKNSRLFSTRLYAYLYRGDESGQNGLTVWNSLLYNWGFAGTMVVCLVLGALMQAFTVKYVRGPRSLIRTVVLFVAAYRLALVRDPYSLLLDGFITTVLFYWLVKMVAGSRWLRVRARPGESDEGERNVLVSSGRGAPAVT
jgi:oligosaccharide repeat unit polymerase